MSMPTLQLNVSTSSPLALIQRLREETVIQMEYEGADRAVIGDFLTLLDTAQERMVALDREIQVIAADPDTSDAKKTKLAVEAVARAYKDLQAVRKAMTTKSGAVADAKAKLFSVTEATTDATTDFLLCSEIRSRLSALPQHERMTRILEAIASGRMQVIRSIQLDPLPSKEFLPSDFLARAIEEHAQQTAPTAWTRLKTLELIVDRLNTLATAIDLSLANYGTLPNFDGKSTRHVDLKQQNPQRPPDSCPATDKTTREQFQ
jgi:hypothetical protein